MYWTVPSCEAVTIEVSFEQPEESIVGGVQVKPVSEPARVQALAGNERRGYQADPPENQEPSTKNQEPSTENRSSLLRLLELAEQIPENGVPVERPDLADGVSFRGGVEVQPRVALVLPVCREKLGTRYGLRR